MKKSTAKALYLYLTSILGMVMFAMLHRSVFVLYDLLLVVDFDTYSFGMSSATIMRLDFLTMVLVIFLGGWYGIVLGIEWYSMVYGPNAEHKAGWFHGFVPHHWRKGARKTGHSHSAHSGAPTAKSETVTVPVTEHNPSWSFDDFAALAEPKKKTTRKPAAKKAVRKTTKRSKVATE